MDYKWTRGPWVVVADETAAQVRGYPCIYADGYTVVGTEGMYSDIETDFANARLIAAAPDLYMALEAILLGELDTDVRRSVEQLLAKARGVND
jgi:hypothetical protein